MTITIGEWDAASTARRQAWPDAGVLLDEAGHDELRHREFKERISWDRESIRQLVWLPSGITIAQLECDAGRPLTAAEIRNALQQACEL
jgi:hypothetical protein